MYVNLLPNDFVAQHVMRRQCRAWFIVVAIAIACSGAIYVKNLAQVALLRRQVDGESLKHPGLRQTAAEVAQWERKLVRAKAVASAIDRVRTDKRSLTLVGLIARSALMKGGKTRLQHLNIQLPSARADEHDANGGQAQHSGPGAPTEAGRGSLILDGLADDANTISRFVAMLRETGILSQVNLKGSSETAAGSDHCRQFQIECEF
jgi:Tfp pilus assembly protein PilN